MSSLPNSTGKPSAFPSTKYNFEPTKFTDAHAELNKQWVRVCDAIGRFGVDQGDESRANLDRELCMLAATITPMRELIGGR